MPDQLDRRAAVPRRLAEQKLRRAQLAVVLEPHRMRVRARVVDDEQIAALRRCRQQPILRACAQRAWDGTSARQCTWRRASERA